jgi:hypothetical protein
MNAHHAPSIICAILIALVLAAMPVTGAYAQSSPQQYFPETGHTVSGDFLNYFNARGGLKIFGYPITDVFDWNGRRIQYFQRARMELHPENPVPYRVQLGLLGDELGHRSLSSSPPVPNDASHRYYPETGHVVAYAFLNFFDKNGGLDIFGYPITDFESENGRIVQYFQRARLEWHPELSGDQRVQLGDLGTIHFDSAGFDPSLKQPKAPSQFGTPLPPVTLKVTASVKAPITARTGTQTLYVYVLDQTNQPIGNASVSFTTRDASGERSYEMLKTNGQGFTSYTFNIGNTRPGQVVVIQVHAAFNELAAAAQTSFFTWY